MKRLTVGDFRGLHGLLELLDRQWAWVAAIAVDVDASLSLRPGEKLEYGHCASHEEVPAAVVPLEVACV